MDLKKQVLKDIHKKKQKQKLQVIKNQNCMKKVENPSMFYRWKVYNPKAAPIKDPRGTQTTLFKL